MANNNNQQVQAVGATSNDSPNTQYYKQVYKTTGLKMAGVDYTNSDGKEIVTDGQMIADAMANSKTGTVNPFLMMIMLNDYSTMYGMQLQTSQVYVVDSAQTLSDDWSKVLQDLQTVESMAADGKNVYSDYKNIQNTLKNDLNKLYMDMQDMYNNQAKNLPQIPDGNGGWKENPCTQDFNDMLQQSQDNLSAFFSFSPFYSGLNSVEDSYAYGMYNSNSTGTYQIAMTHQQYVDGTDTDSTLPDYLDKLINGGIDLVYSDAYGTPATGSNSGADPFVTTYLQSLMSRYSQTIQLDTGNINNIYDINKQITQSAQKEYGTYVQNQLAR